MAHYLKTILGKHPRVVIVLLAFVLVTGMLSGLYLYALQQWQDAQTAVKEGRTLEARRSLNLCLRVWPRSAAVHLLAARSARLSGEFAEAEKHLNHCLKLQQGDTASVELEFLLLRVQTGEADEVAPMLWQCVEAHHPETPLILETLAQAYIHNLRYGPALGCLDRCIQDAPARAPSFYWRGWIFERLSDRVQALKDYQRALEVDPELVPARLHLAELHLQMSNAQQALPQLEWLRRRFPDRADVQARLGQYHLLCGELEEARYLLEAAVEKLPADLTLLLQLGRLEIQQGRPTRAETWLHRALAVDPTDPEVQYVLISCLRHQNRLDEAEVLQEQYRNDVAQMKRVNQVLREETQHPTSNADALFEVGTVLLRGRQDHLGLYWLHKALERDAEHQPAHKALADYYESKGETTKVTQHRRHIHTPAEDTKRGGGQYPRQTGGPP